MSAPVQHWNEDFGYVVDGVGPGLHLGGGGDLKRVPDRVDERPARLTVHYDVGYPPATRGDSHPVTGPEKRQEHSMGYLLPYFPL